MTHWPWATIAAFSAAGAALWGARNETQERTRLLGRETVLDLGEAALKWNTEAASFLGAMRRYLNGTIRSAAVNGEALDRYTEASRAVTRALLTARMVCTDKTLQQHIAEVEDKVKEFSMLLDRSESETLDEQRQRLDRTIHDGLRTLHEFAPVVDAALTRGFELYSSGRRRQL